MRNELDYIMNLHTNKYKCVKCGFTVKIPIETPGQIDLFPPLCPYCGTETRKEASK